MLIVLRLILLILLQWELIVIDALPQFDTAAVISIQNELNKHSSEIEVLLQVFFFLQIIFVEFFISHFPIFIFLEKFMINLLCDTFLSTLR